MSKAGAGRSTPKEARSPTPGASGASMGSRNPIWSDPNMIPIAVAVLVIILTILFLFKRKSKGRVVLLVGPTDVGKSAMFSRVIGGKNVLTVTSLAPNEGEYLPSNSKAALTIKDLPGHERVRIKFWETCRAGARGIICIVDASGGNKAVRESAEIIYTVLTDPNVTSVRSNILIFANKQDAPLAKAVSVVKTQLERELTTLRMTKSAGLTSTGGGNSSEKFLGKPDKDFEFAHAAHLRIDFAEGSCTKGEGQLTVVTDWLDSIA